MGEALKKSILEVVDLPSIDDKSSVDLVKLTHTPELVIALCGFIGTDINGFANKLGEILSTEYQYKVQPIIKLSKIIEKNTSNLEKFEEKPNGSENYNKTQEAIYYGNQLRKKYGGSVLAEAVINKIGHDRAQEKVEREDGKENEGQTRFKPRRVCYIIDSLKHPKELEILKYVYRDLLFSIGVFSPLHQRNTYLRRKEFSNKEIVDIIDQDYNEINPETGKSLEYGQSVGKLFPLSDLFVRLDSDSSSLIETRIKRFLHLIFGTKVITPTTDETAMYFAASAATNSACLSRQVGAAITDKNGNIISTGWNDVPKFGGNLYQFDKDDPLGSRDKRCFNLQGGKCYNDSYKKKITNELVEHLIKKKILNEEARDIAIKELRKAENRLQNLSEFSRVVHAEMHAIIIGSQNSGDKMIGGKLYSILYPCHNCARHIVLAGIKEVYYIEPYNKSLCIELHEDSITETEGDSNKVKMLMYDGVSPNKYLQFFKSPKGSRKNKETGGLAKRDPKTAYPILTESLEALFTLESIATVKFNKTKLIF